MEQKSRPKRGWPRGFDPEVAAGQAAGVFAKRGLSAASMDEIAAATGLYRTSLAAAFSDKRGVYLAALRGYQATARQRMADALAQASLRGALHQFFAGAVSAYLGDRGGHETAPGCLLIGTAVTEAATDPEIRRVLAEALAEIDRALADRFVAAQHSHELGDEADPEALAQVVSSALYAIAIRARAGAPRVALEQIAGRTIDVVCGPDRERRTAAV